MVEQLVRLIANCRQCVSAYLASRTTMEGKMLTGLCDHVDDLLRAVRGDEDAFNRFAEAERLGVYLRHGRIYPSAIGQTHTSRLAGGLLSVGADRCRIAVGENWPSRLS